MIKICLFILSLFILNSCYTSSSYNTPMERAKGNAAEVYVEDEFKTLQAYEASNLANQHCAKHGKIAQYEGMIRGLPQMWHFKCVKE